MKQSLNKHFRSLLILLFLILILQFIIVEYTIFNSADLFRLAADIQSVLIIFLFAVFIYLVVIYNYLPFRLKRSVKRVQELVEEISNGNYQLDIESSLLGQDEDFRELIFALRRMLEIIMRFDAAKAEKIFEHHQRISQLIDILPMEVLILTINGEISYMNDKFRARHPSLDDNMSLSAVFFKEEFKRRIFDFLWDSVRRGDNVYDETIRDPEASKEVLIKGSIIRDRKGSASGAVFTLEYSDVDK